MFGRATAAVAGSWFVAGRAAWTAVLVAHIDCGIGFDQCRSMGEARDVCFEAGIPIVVTTRSVLVGEDVDLTVDSGCSISSGTQVLYLYTHPQRELRHTFHRNGATHQPAPFLTLGLLRMNIRASHHIAILEAGIG